MRLAVIPARGGSKRIPRKNIKQFCGKPIIAWTVEAAHKCGCFDRIMITTDDDEIARIAVDLGAEVPFIRPVKLADDYTATVPVVQHAVRWFEEHEQKPDEVCCIYATAPLILPADIESGLNILRDKKCDYVFSATNYPYPIQRAFKLTLSEQIEMFDPTRCKTRSQDLEEAWHDAGQFYWARSDVWLSGKDILSSNASIVKIPRYRVQDIDTEEDWIRAEWMFKAMQGRPVRK